MIKKIIKDRRQILEGVIMVSALYIVIAVHSFRLIYEKDSRTH